MRFHLPLFIATVVVESIQIGINRINRWTGLQCRRTALQQGCFTRYGRTGRVDALLFAPHPDSNNTVNPLKIRLRIDHPFIL